MTQPLRLRAATPALCVLAQQRHPRERLAAVRARVLLHVRMGLQVGAQVRAVGERPIAVRAREGLLPRVRPDVALQQPGARERLAAYRALAGQRVRADVHLEGAQRHVHLLAVLAAEGLARALARRAVELAVFGQAREGRVALPAVGTLVPDRGRAGLLGEVFGRRRGGRRAGTEGRLAVRREDCVGRQRGGVRGRAGALAAAGVGEVIARVLMMVVVVVLVVDVRSEGSWVNVPVPL